MRGVIWTLSLLAGLVACASDRHADRMAPGLMLDSAAVGRSRAGASDQGTAVGFSDGFGSGFFNDGSDGDGQFVDTDGDGLPDARGAEGGADGRPPQEPQQSQQPQRRMLVYTGQVNVEVPRAEDAAHAFLARIEQWGGYLQRQSGATLTVRLPAKHFDAAFASVRESGRVLSESRQANDVTEEFVDLEIRVGNVRQARGRLLEILKLAEKVEDILKVEAELRRLTDEIERMEGRLKYLRDQVAMATLRAHFQDVAEPPPVKRRRRPSRFRWVNRVGAGAVMEGF